MLEVAAAVLAAGTLFSSWELTYTDQNRFFGGGDTGVSRIPGTFKFAQFIQNMIGTLAWCLLVLAAGLALEIVALRAERSTVPAPDPFAPDTSPAISPNPPAGLTRNGPAIPLVAPRRDAPITVEVDESLWRR